jgi:hypothetical protein
VGAEQERVLEGGKAEGKEGVEPESNGHARDSPGTVGVVGFVCLDDVFLRSCDDGSDREEKRTKEQSLAFVRDGCLERTRELCESENHCSCNTNEEDQVEDVEDSANGDEAWESMRLDGDECTQSACGHGQSVPRPGEVTETLGERQVWLVGVLLMWNLGVVIPATVTMSIVMLLFLEVDSAVDRSRWRRPWRVVEWVLPRPVWGFGVDRVTIDINWPCVVYFSCWVRLGRGLHPGVGSCCLGRLSGILVVLLGLLGILVLWAGLAHVLGFGLRDVSRLSSIHRPLRVWRPLRFLGTHRSNCGRKALLYRVQTGPGVRLGTRVLGLLIVVEVGVEGVLAVVEGKTLWLESGIHY